MPAPPPVLPTRRPDLVLTPFGEKQYVVKDPAKRRYYNLGECEYFLLSSLDGQSTPDEICAAFEAQFGEPLSVDDLCDFIEMADKQGLLGEPPAPDENYVPDDTDEFGDEVEDSGEPGKPRRRQSWLFFRKSLVDPDRFLTWLAPRTEWIFTGTFVACSALTVCGAGLVAWVNRHDLVNSFPLAFRWEMWLLAWVVLIVATGFHELAHGLACKQHGGEVHEIGVLFMFFTPCLYCDVSDAWLIPRKSHRLWVTLAGGYCDLCLWAAAMLAWRLTMQHTVVNYVAWIVLSICGTRIFFNFNPLMKLDGYYLLSDWLEVPNLRRRGWEFWLANLRWVLWGAERPPETPRGRALLCYGSISWTFSFIFLDLMFFRLFKYLGSYWGVAGLAGTLLLGSYTIKRLFKGLFAGEFFKMISTRHLRTALWVGGLASLPVFLLVFQIEDRAAGSFQVRPGTRVEIRAKVAGFLKEVKVGEGDQISTGQVVGVLEIPDLASQIAQRQAAVQESEANLRRLEVGSRPEEIVEQGERIKRAMAWRDLAKKDLDRAQRGLKEELARLDQQIAQHQTELHYASHAHDQAERLHKRGVMAGEQYRGERKKQEIAELQLKQAQAQRATRVHSGVQEFESELARREKDLKDEQAKLSLLEAGARPEEIDAERARLSRLQEELNYFESLKDKIRLDSPVAGLVTTPRLHEKVGQYFQNGELICTIEQITPLEAEIAVPEDEVQGVSTGQIVQLKARALPFETFEAHVDRIAPIAVTNPGDTQGRVTVYCRVDNPEGALRPGMTGFGRIYRNERSVAAMLGRRALRYVRTEFWW